jgi:hypothetical protein
MSQFRSLRQFGSERFHGHAFSAHAGKQVSNIGSGTGVLGRWQIRFHSPERRLPDTCRAA